MLRHIPFYASLLGRKLKDGSSATHSHVLVYGAVEAHAMGEKGCIASNQTIADECGLKLSTAAKCMSQIAQSGWVKVELVNGQRQGVEPLLTIADPLLPSKPPFTVEKTPLYSGVNIEDSIDNKENNSRTSSSLPSKEVKELHSALTGLVPTKRYRLRDKRAAALKKALKSNTQEEILLAARTMLADEWWVKTKGYGGSLDYMLEDSRRVDNWLDKADNTNKPQTTTSAPLFIMKEE